MAHQNDGPADGGLDEFEDYIRSLNLTRPMVPFRRPDRGLPGIFSRLVGPLPKDTPLYQPTRAALGELRSYRLPALGLIVGAIALLIGLVVVVPWMRISPYIIIRDAYAGVLGDPWAGIATWATVVVLILAFNGGGGTSIASYQGKFWDKAAMYEEQWFRTGAENWSTAQRVRSVVSFGLVHVLNIIYPIASLVVVTLMGAVFMKVYLSNYRRTGSAEKATLASAKLHATYNRFAILYFLVAISLVTVLLMIYPS